MSALSSSQAARTAPRDASTSLASSGIGIVHGASTSSDGVGRLFLTRKLSTFAVSLAMMEESSTILFVTAMLMLSESWYQYDIYHAMLLNEGEKSMEAVDDLFTHHGWSDETKGMRGNYRCLTWEGAVYVCTYLSLIFTLM